MVIDAVSILTFLVCLYAIYAWLTGARSWPLRWAVIIAMFSNISFLIARTLGLFSPLDLNLFSAVRVLITVIVLAVIPSSVRRIDQ